jgi:hypothetical protein
MLKKEVAPAAFRDMAARSQMRQPMPGVFSAISASRPQNSCHFFGIFRSNLLGPTQPAQSPAPTLPVATAEKPLRPIVVPATIQPGLCRSAVNSRLVAVRRTPAGVTWSKDFDALPVSRHRRVGGVHASAAGVVVGNAFLPQGLAGQASQGRGAVSYEQKKG